MGTPQIWNPSNISTHQIRFENDTLYAQQKV